MVQMIINKITYIWKQKEQWYYHFMFAEVADSLTPVILNLSEKKHSQMCVACCQIACSRKTGTSMGGSANPILQTKWALSLVRTTRTEEQER